MKDKEENQFAPPKLEEPSPQLRAQDEAEEQPDAIAANPRSTEVQRRSVDAFESPELLIGKTIAAHYEVISCLGQGGMSTVYKTRHLLLGSVRAVKILHVGRGGDAKLLMRFQQEAKASHQLEHENIVRVYEFGIEANLEQPYLVMECIEGLSLNRRLEDGPLQASETINIIEQVCAALKHAHAKGIVHRDIKPANIILVKDDRGGDVVKLVDFGIAKLTSPEEGFDLTQTGEIFGTPLYMSPEQCLGRSVDARSDIYSLACVMYECLTGRPPFVANSPLETLIMHVQQDFNCDRSDIPPKLQELLKRCLRKDAQERYQSADDLMKDLRGVDENKSLSSDINAVKTKVRDLDKRLQNLKTPQLLMVLIVVILLCSLMLMSYRGRQSQETAVPVTAPVTTEQAASPPPSVSHANQSIRAKKRTNLPQELDTELRYATSPGEHIDILLAWQKRHPEFNYFVENELRHWYGSVDQYKCAQHADAILTVIPMDNYTLQCMSAWTLGKGPAQAASHLLYWINAYPDLVGLKAACCIAVGDEYAHSGRSDKARAYYERVAALREPSMARYRAHATSRIEALAK